MPIAENVTFSKKLFNPNYWHLIEAMQDPTRRFIFAYGGSSSAKSYSTAQAIAVFACLIEGSDTMVFRKVGATVRKSIFKDFVTIIKSFKLDEYFTILDLKIRCYNGAGIDFGGVDDPEKIKGISNYKRVFLDELSEFDYSDFKQVRKRLRGQVGQQIIGVFNPIDIDHWIKTELFDVQVVEYLPRDLMLSTNIPTFESETYTEVDEKWQGAKIIVDGITYPPNFVVIKSTYKNNFWVVGSPCHTYGFYDVQTIADFERDKLEDFDFYSIYALGNWGKLNRGGEFYKRFSTQKHVAKVLHDPERSLHLTFDENVNPYLTLDVWQGQELSVQQIDEICLVDPRNTLNETLKEFVERYPNNGQPIYIYGDATSKKQDAKLEKGKNFYTLIENFLQSRNYTTTRRVPSSNPNPEMRGAWLNRIFGDGLDDIEITIGDNCIKTIGDYNYLKTASDGTKHKERVKDPTTKVTYEKYGHNTDANDYFLTVYFDKSFTKFKSPQGTAKARIQRKVIKKRY